MYMTVTNWDLMSREIWIQLHFNQLQKMLKIFRSNDKQSHTILFHQLWQQINHKNNLVRRNWQNHNTPHINCNLKFDTPPVFLYQITCDQVMLTSFINSRYMRYDKITITLNVNGRSIISLPFSDPLKTEFMFFESTSWKLFSLAVRSQGFFSKLRSIQFYGYNILSIYIMNTV